MNASSGTFNGYKRTRGYNNRLQPCRIHVTTGSVPTDPCNESPPTVGNVLDLAYDFNQGVANNGNVMGITNNITNDRTQSFTYDELNRVTSGQSQAADRAFSQSRPVTYYAPTNNQEQRQQ